MSGTASAITGLKQQRPEWAPWLAVVEETLGDVDAPGWGDSIPAAATGGEATAPLLARATVSVEDRAVRNLLQRLTRVASRNGPAQMMTLRSAVDAETDVLSLFKASLCQNTAAIKGAAASCGADAGAFEAVIGLLCVPFLQACHRQWAQAASAGWVEGYCYVCGAWPTFAESRGIERKRFFRCGRCGSAWHARPLHCAYCGMDDHSALVSLVPQEHAANATIEGCNACFGYVKIFTTLQGCLPGMVMLEDLASVYLDVAALEQGYRRSPGLGYPIEVMVTAKRAQRRVFGWGT